MSKKRTRTNKRASRNEEIRSAVLLAMFIAIIFLLTFTPIGFINLVVIKATIIHVPVIIGSILLGPKKGAILGASFGLASLIVNTITPSALSFAFSPLIPVPLLGRGSPLALLVCFLPRILVGIIPWYFYRSIHFLKKHETQKGRSILLAVSGVVGSFANTIFVMGMIYLIFRDAYAQIKNVSPEVVLTIIMGVVGTNGVLEAIVASILTAAVCLPLQKLLRQDALRGSSIATPKKDDIIDVLDKPKPSPLSPETTSALSAFEQTYASEKNTAEGEDELL